VLYQLSYTPIDVFKSNWIIVKKIKAFVETAPCLPQVVREAGDLLGQSSPLAQENWQELGAGWLIQIRQGLPKHLQITT
jgi:hypothetical protein